MAWVRMPGVDLIEGPEDTPVIGDPFGQKAEYSEPFFFAKAPEYMYPEFGAEQDEWAQARARRQEAAASALKAQEAGLEGLMGTRSGIEGARDAAIRQARSAAARSMFGLAGGIGNLAGSGAVRSGLAQTGITRAMQEQGARAQAAKELGGLEQAIAEKEQAISAARLEADPAEIAQREVEEFLPRFTAIANANIGASYDAKMSAISQIEAEAALSPYPEVHQAALAQIYRLLGRM